MIYTCTMNPAIDIVIGLDEFLPRVVNRSQGQTVLPNGKGVNISFVLKMLGFGSVATGFSAGFTGRFNEEELEKKGVRPEFVEVPGLTRLNVFIRVYSGDTEYKLVNPGPSIAGEDLEKLLSKIRALGPEDILCISGSTPPGIPDDIYLQIARIAQERAFRLVLDSSHRSIPETAFCRPYLIKPNIDELADWFGEKSLSREQAVARGRDLARKGFQHVLVSLGEEGCLYINEHVALYANAPQGEVVNTACAGDTTLATFLSGLLQGREVAESLRYAVSAGSSTAFRAGLTDFSDVADLAEQVTVKELLIGG